MPEPVLFQVLSAGGYDVVFVGGGRGAVFSGSFFESGRCFFFVVLRVFVRVRLFIYYPYSGSDGTPFDGLVYRVLGDHAAVPPALCF